MRTMTVEEFYEYMKEKGCLDYTINIAYRDEGGYYAGQDEFINLEIDDEKKVVVL